MSGDEPLRLPSLHSLSGTTQPSNSTTPDLSVPFNNSDSSSTTSTNFNSGLPFNLGQSLFNTTSTAPGASGLYNPINFPPFANSTSSGSGSTSSATTQLPILAASNEASTSKPPIASKPGKKRKSAAGAGGGGASERAASGSGDEDEAAKAKRQKTPRACDNCRRKKIRCNPLPDLEPPLCAHCQSHGVECTWFLPIAETRFKKKKEEAAAAAASSSAATTSLATGPVAAAAARATAPAPSSQQGPSPIFNLPRTHSATPGEVYPVDAPQRQNSSGSSPYDGNGLGMPRKEARLVGPTSVSHLMHSTSTFPTERMVPVDFKYSQSLTVNETGDGFIRVVSSGDGDPSDETVNTPRAIQGLESGVAEQLLNYYFDTHSAHFPVVTRSDFAASGNPPLLLFNALCGISALSHHVAPSILRTIKGTIRGNLREEDILDNSSISNIQALLVYAFSLELEKGTAASKTWNLLGVAIRMAQDLGLHRKLGTERGEQSEADHTELRRRVWGGCLIADRWISAIYGQPMMIDLADCDCLLPSVFDIRPAQQFDSERKPYLFNGALLSLSILLGRILKGVYSPTGIMTLSSEDATSLTTDLKAWVSGLPEELRFQGPEKSSPAQGFLHLLYIPVRFLLTRPFMRISFQLPERFANVSVGTVQWSVVEAESREAIEWVDKNEQILEGWFVGIYSFFVCCLVQYHSHIRRRDPKSLATLRLARDTMKRLIVPEGETHLRSKIGEITHLLYHTAVSVQKWAPEAAEGLSPASAGTTAITTLNPTLGVRQREQDWHLRYKKDGARSYFVSERPNLASPAFSNTSSPHLSSPLSTTITPATSTSVSTPPLLSSSSSVRTSAPAATTSNSNYASSLRSTHVSGEEDQQQQQQQVPTPTAAAATTPGGTNLFDFLGGGAGTNGNGNNGFVASPQGLSPGAAGAGASTLGAGVDVPSATTTTETTLPDLSFPESFNFNPSLNNNSSFDPFGYAGDGTPSLFPPEGIFDWGGWSSFFSGVQPDGTGPPS